MKPLFIVIALAGTLMTTAGALAYHPTGPSPSREEIEQNEFRHVQEGWFPGKSSVRTEIRRRSLNPAHDVYVNGRYVGSDPDPRIRSQLARDNCVNNNTGC